jgi:hypothetical protein
LDDEKNADTVSTDAMKGVDNNVKNDDDDDDDDDEFSEPRFTIPENETIENISLEQSMASSTMH